VAYFAVRLPFTDELQHCVSVTIRLDTLTRAPAEHNSTLASGRHARTDRSRSKSRSNSASADMREAINLPCALRRSNCNRSDHGIAARGIPHCGHRLHLRRRPIVKSSTGVYYYDLAITSAGGHGVWKYRWKASGELYVRRSEV
jgi:hypothetical protein